MAEKLLRTRAKRRGNRTVMTKLMNEVDSLLKAEPSDKKRLKAIATSLNEKLNLVKTLDEEIIENCAVEEVEAEIEESDEFNTRVLDLLRVINEATSSKDNNTGLSTVPTKNINETTSQSITPSGSSGTSTWASENNVQLPLPGSATYGGFHSFNVTSSSTCHVENMQSSGNSVVVKANSIVAAAAGGLLKVPEIKKPAITSTTEQGAVQTGAGMTIADAAKSGFLAVPTAGEKKENDNLPPNVNLFASTSASTAKKETGVSFAAPSTAPLPFQFGAATTASPATAGAFGQGPSEGASSNPAFQFGAVTSSASGSLSQATSSVTPAPSPFSLVSNAVSTAKTTATTPFNFVANAGAPVTTPAPTFAFGSNTATAVAVSTGTVGTFQFSASGTVAKPTAQVDSLAVFNFGPSNTTPATSAATQTGKLTFGMPAEPATSSSSTVKPFGFNVGSAAQGFSFAATKPNEATTDQPTTFSFGLSAAKPDTGFPTFGVSQSTSSNQQASASSFMFGPSSSSAPAGSEETMEADGGNSSTNLFGSSANAAPPAFGSVAPAAGFNFGVPNAPGTGGFNFGGAQTNTGPSTFGFASIAGGAPGFGATNAPAASASTPGGFNFTPVDNSAAAPAMFNFAGGAPQSQGNVMFTTGVGSDLSNPGMTRRRFTRAVRRTAKR